MKTRTLKLQSKSTKSVGITGIDLIKSIRTVGSKLIIFVFTLTLFILNIAIKIAQMLLKGLLIVCKYLLSQLRKLWKFQLFRGFILGFFVASILYGTYIYNSDFRMQSVQSSTTPQVVDDIKVEDNNKEIASVSPVIAPAEIVIERDWNSINFVSLSYSEKVNILSDYMREINIPENEIDTYIRIATAESCKGKEEYPLDVCMNPTRVPPVAVKHCKGPNGWYVVEINANGGQAQCGAGHTEGRNEKSFGIFQILETTWEGHNCTGDRYDWMAQVECAKTIKETSGFTSWSTY